MLTIEEARDYINNHGGPLCQDDQWCAVSGRDWVEVGTSIHRLGASHVHECGGYPPWGDNPYDTTYGLPYWNFSILYKDYNCFELIPAMEIIKAPVKKRREIQEHAQA